MKSGLIFTDEDFFDLQSNELKSTIPIINSDIKKFESKSLNEA
jgi:hypothetical protein